MGKFIQPAKTETWINTKSEQKNYLIRIFIKSQKLQTNKGLGQDSFTGEFYEILQDSIQIFLKLFQKIDKEGILPNSLYKADIIQYWSQQ